MITLDSLPASPAGGNGSDKPGAGAPYAARGTSPAHCRPAPCRSLVAPGKVNPHSTLIGHSGVQAPPPSLQPIKWGLRHRLVVNYGRGLCFCRELTPYYLHVCFWWEAEQPDQCRRAAQGIRHAIWQLCAMKSPTLPLKRRLPYLSIKHSHMRLLNT